MRLNTDGTVLVGDYSERLAPLYTSTDWLLQRVKSAHNLKNLSELLMQLDERLFTFNAFFSSKTDAQVALPDEEHDVDGVHEYSSSWYAMQKYMRTRERVVADFLANDCGTRACAAGWATALPWAYQEPITLQYVSSRSGHVTMEARKNGESIFRNSVAGGDSNAELQLFFGLSKHEVEVLFYGLSHRNVVRKDVPFVKTSAAHLSVQRRTHREQTCAVSTNLRLAAEFIEAHPGIAFATLSQDEHLDHSFFAHPWSTS